MKPYAIIKQQPQLFNVYRVKVRQEINPQININAIEKVKPNMLDTFSSMQIHTIAKHYQSRKSRMPSYERMYNSAGKYHRKPIFKQRDYTQLDLTGIKKQYKSLNDSSKIGSNIKEENHIQNINNRNQRSNVQSKQIQQQNINKNNESNLHQIKNEQNSYKTPYKPIFKNRPQSYELVESILQNNQKQLNQNSIVQQQQAKNSRYKSCQSYKHKPIFSKQNKMYEAQILKQKTKVPFDLKFNQLQKTSQKLKIYSHYGQINYEGSAHLQQKISIKDQTPASKLQQTVKKSQKNIQIDECIQVQQSNFGQDRKINEQYENHQYQQKPFCKTPPSKPIKQVNSIKRSDIDIRQSNKSQQNTKVKSQKQKQMIFQQQIDKKSQSKSDIKVSVENNQNKQDNPKKFKKVIGLKSSKNKNSKNHREKEVSQKVHPRIIRLKSKKSQKEQKESKDSRIKSEHSSEKLKQESQCGSSVSVQVIKILNMNPFYI